MLNLQKDKPVDIGTARVVHLKVEFLLFLIILLLNKEVITLKSLLTFTKAMYFKENCANTVCRYCPFYNGNNCNVAAIYLQGTPHSYNIQNMFPEESK